MPCCSKCTKNCFLWCWSESFLVGTANINFHCTLISRPYNSESVKWFKIRNKDLFKKRGETKSWIFETETGEEIRKVSAGNRNCDTCSLASISDACLCEFCVFARTWLIINTLVLRSQALRLVGWFFLDFPRMANKKVIRGHYPSARWLNFIQFCHFFGVFLLENQNKSEHTFELWTAWASDLNNRSFKQSLNWCFQRNAKPKWELQVCFQTTISRPRPVFFDRNWRSPERA